MTNKQLIEKISELQLENRKLEEKYIELLEANIPQSTGVDDIPIPQIWSDNYQSLQQPTQTEERVVEIERNRKWWFHHCPCWACISVFWTNYCFDCWAKIKRVD